MILKSFSLLREFIPPVICKAHFAMHEKYTCLLCFARVTGVDISLDNNAGFSTLCPENMTGKFAVLKEEIDRVYYSKLVKLSIILELSRHTRFSPK